MATENFDGNTLRKVQTMLRKGQVGILRDTQAKGLSISVYRTQASWMYRTRDGALTIAPLDMFGADDIPLLRQLVTEAKIQQKEWKSLEDFFEAFRSNKDVRLSKNVAEVGEGIGKIWEEVRDAYLKWAADHKEKDTVRGYKSALGATPDSVLAEDFKPLHNKPITSISTRDLVRVRTNIIERGNGLKIRQANLTVAALKSCFKWYLNQPDALIDVSPAETLTKAMERGSQKKTTAEQERTFSQKEIGLLLLGLQFVNNSAAKNSLLLQLLTGQRRLTPLEAKKADFVESEHYGLIWRLSDKVGAWRALPLSPKSVKVVENAKENARADNEYLFPQQRPTKVGKADSGHMNERTVSAVLEDLRSDGGILEALPFTSSTHDLRKTFVTVMSPRLSHIVVSGVRLAPKDIKMITHDDEGRDTTASAVYDKNECLDTKYSILCEWEKWCFEGLELVKSNMRYAKYLS